MDRREYGIVMVLVVGGSFQGKLEYVKKELEKQGILLSEEETADGRTFDLFGDHSKCKKPLLVFNRLHDMVLRCMQEMPFDDAEQLMQTCKGQMEPLLAHFPQIVIICDEVGYGVIPLEREQRIYREAVGRLLCDLAQRAEKMERIVGGFPIRIK